MIWPHASKERPCVVCGGLDWCTFGDRSMLCQRVESQWPAAKGGWYHGYGGSKPVNIPKPKAAPKWIDAEKIMNILHNSTSNYKNRSYEIADKLSVAQHSIISLYCAYSFEYKAWAFPMRDGDNKIIGIRLRNSAGDKWAVTGSRQGIFIPLAGCPMPYGIAYLPEGPTDVAALLTMGLFAIGRPTCNSGNDFIKIALKRLGIRRVVIIADNDEIKATGKRPGLDGAVKLKKELNLPSVIWMPPSPIKDVRQFLIKGGTKEMIESELKNRVWTKI